MAGTGMNGKQWRTLRDKGLQKLLAPLALVLIYLFFGFFGRNFFSYNTLVNILDASYYIGFLALGVTFVIITGGIDLSVGTVAMCAAIVGGTAFRTWGWSMGPSLVLIMAVATFFGLINGLMVAKLKLPPFIATLGMMMVSMGIGSIVSNVRSAAFPPRSDPSGWFRNIFKYISPDRVAIPTGALVLFGVTIIFHIILTRTKMGRYIFAIGSNKEAARLSGVKVERWEMSAYIVSGIAAGISGISFAAVYTTVMPAQGQGFELFAIAGAVIGGTSLSGGVGSVFGTLIGVFIMAVLRSGLPAMNLQAHYQTFFTGIVVIAAVLLDIYRTKKTSEVRVLTPADLYRSDMQRKIDQIRGGLSSTGGGSSEDIPAGREQIQALQQEMKETYRRMRREEKAEAARVEAEEKAAEREFRAMLKKEKD
ncbi:monosaccharide ABC transporter membrane protein, CUT2 family [Alkalispirochaeta americana]|uniref:Monosaccharide ABC transporter membrane protein, CUT2 family n=1 Tax=Alkalispirochaeta americana TaxID=159291 RepID=A0A1N6THW7_9SPIO|nr:ABC transporter permease [Alkalispirochaeta americana]SIQ52969.1 monosaccharide ABC transporter membrane protein, CUT2 family [Alkalispirochaeta americana]